MSSLQDKTIHGIIWSAAHRFGVMAITFVSSIVLARLLSPHDYGCIGMLMIFITLANTCIDGGFGAALIQKKNPTQEDYSTIFFWNICISIVLYIILYLTAPAIASFYNLPILTSILRIQGIILPINTLSIIQQNILRKHLYFSKLAIGNISSAIISLIIAIVVAYNGYGVWALVAQQLSFGLFNAIIFWTICEWKPLLIFSKKSFKELFNFGVFMLISNLFSALSNEIQGLLVGRAFSPSTMGLYTQAYKLEGSIATATSSVIDQVTFPVLSSIQDDKEIFNKAYKRFIQIPTLICAPLMMLMIVTAKPLITILFSEQWIDSTPYFQILCTAGLAVCLQGAANNAIAAIGKSKVLFKWTIIKRSITIILCIIGIQVAGMYGLLWSCAIGAWIVFFINASLVSRHVGYSFIAQIKDIAPFVIISTIIGLIIFWIGQTIALNEYLVAIIQIILGTTTYIITLSFFKIEAFVYIRNLLVSKLRKA